MNMFCIWILYDAMCVLHSIFFEIFVSEVIYFIHQNVVIVRSVWYSLLLRNNLFILHAYVDIYCTRVT